MRSFEDVESKPKFFGVASGAGAFYSQRVTNAFEHLTEKEKETLRLIVRGHDAKSVANAEYVAAPPQGYVRVIFRTKFSNREGATESVTLEKEDGIWKAVGDVID